MHKISRLFEVSASFLFVLMATAIAASAQTLTTLLSFDGTDGGTQRRMGTWETNAIFILVVFSGSPCVCV